MKTNSSVFGGSGELTTVAALATPVSAQDEPKTQTIKYWQPPMLFRTWERSDRPPGQPFHLADNGLISGSAAYNGKEQATLWYKRWKANIGMGGGNSVAFGVNQLGQAVGEADTSTPDPNGEDFLRIRILRLCLGKDLPAFSVAGRRHDGASYIERQQRKERQQRGRERN